MTNHLLTGGSCSTLKAAKLHSVQQVVSDRFPGWLSVKVSHALGGTLGTLSGGSYLSLTGCNVWLSKSKVRHFTLKQNVLWISAPGLKHWDSRAFSRIPAPCLLQGLCGLASRAFKGCPFCGRHESGPPWLSLLSWVPARLDGGPLHSGQAARHWRSHPSELAPGIDPCRAAFISSGF